MRTKILLQCSKCNNLNYLIDKNKVKHPEKEEYRKFCKKCNQYTIHKEKTKLK